jgi:hypothetical protein
MRAKVLAFAGILLLAALPLLGHHPFSAEYDWKKPVSVSATVTKFEWANPHSHIVADVKDSDGKTKNWTFELGSISALTKAGWNKSTVKTGDAIMVDAWLARSKPDTANVKSVRLADGRELWGGSSIGEQEKTSTKTAAK